MASKPPSEHECETPSRVSSDFRAEAAVYERLRELAHAIVGRDWSRQTFQPTELVNEATIRLSAAGEVPWDDPPRLIALFAAAIRSVLIDRYRAKASIKRGGAGVRRAGGNATAKRVSLECVSESLETCESPATAIDRLALCEAIGRLKESEPMLAAIVELKYFTGLTVPEIAVVTSISERSVNLKWSEARVWLASELSHQAGA